MDIQDFETVDSIPALYHPDLDLLVLSDLHLGLEGSMTSEGGYVPKFNLDDVLEEIEKARSSTGASRVLVNGDLKNEFRKSYYSEKEEVKKLVQHLKRRFNEAIIVEGNHDQFIEKTVEDEGLEMHDYYLEDGVLFVHGDRKIEEIEEGLEYSTVVIGHEHPSLSLKDEIGVVEKVDCFLYGETEDGKNIIVLPAFSNISSGTRINETPQRELLSPILKEKVDVKGLKAIAVSREAGLFDFPEIGKL
ncbi:metallophosphoesterase [Candidatus Nanosalina sp. VS9-1]|uniref:metallophosphoesterase n=1 Tax=Candidatus Nanosalina sp. VS9-1 TaxID=3388566 RepID=UPI0039E0BB24